MKKNNLKTGLVYLVGAGPGDPDLLTLKGQKVLQEADVVIYDYLANPFLLRHLKKGAKQLYVGKEGSQHTLEQGEINSLIVKWARQGKMVVRLKGGDPFVFGRGGEEAEVLAARGVPFEIVPGITSAIAAPAYAGIPVTHRSATSTLAIVTGHLQESGDTIDWEALSKMGTVVLLMGLGTLEENMRRLIAAGRDPKTPVAVIRWGTRNDQQVVVGTLKDIFTKVCEAGLKPPVVTVVGDVVDLRKKISWFEKRPLFGRKILVTRSREQASELSKLLSDQGANAIEFPTIEIKPPQSFQPLDRAIRHLKEYEWLIFTSVNGVEAFFERLFFLKRDLRDFAGLSIAAIGPATAKAVEGYHLKVELVADEYKAEGLVRSLAKNKIKGTKFLIPRAAEARPVLVQELKRLGAKVDEVAAYQTVRPTSRRKELVQLLKGEKIDLITFASSSTVCNFMEILGKENRSLLKRIPIASIGPITTKTARELSLKVTIEPKKFTIPHLVGEIVRWCKAPVESVISKVAVPRKP